MTNIPDTQPAVRGENIACRLCGRLSDFVFSMTIMGKYNCSYYCCTYCKSLQTEAPYWISEAYQLNLFASDTGAAQRNLSNLAICLATARIFGVSDLLDTGGGDGLLCRLLRDYGLNCYVEDRFATPTYAQPFTKPNFSSPELITAFEVVEHFENPAEQIAKLFRARPKLILISTGIFNSQERDWWYLAPHSGQHVFFYSRSALEFIAQKYNYNLILVGSYYLFVEQASYSSMSATLFKIAGRQKALKLVKAILMIAPTSGVWNDHAMIEHMLADRPRTHDVSSTNQ